MSANQKLNPENEFYQELDEKTRRRSCCTCPVMIILFVLAAFLILGLTFFLYSKIRKVHLTTNLPVKSFSALENPNSPTFTLAITGEELTAASGGELTVGSWQIQNIKYIINELGIEIDGQLVKIFKFDLKITSLPEVSEGPPAGEAGKLKLKIQKINAGRLGLPGFFRVEVENALNNLLDENLADVYKTYQVTDVKLGEDKIIISGKLK